MCDRPCNFGSHFLHADARSSLPRIVLPMARARAGLWYEECFSLPRPCSIIIAWNHTDQRPLGTLQLVISPYGGSSSPKVLSGMLIRGMCFRPLPNTCFYTVIYHITCLQQGGIVPNEVDKGDGTGRFLAHLSGSGIQLLVQYTSALCSRKLHGWRQVRTGN